MREYDGFKPSSGTLILFPVVVILVTLLGFELGGKIVNLQRRVGQLEQQVK